MRGRLVRVARAVPVLMGVPLAELALLARAVELALVAEVRAAERVSIVAVIFLPPSMRSV
jgi:hypothetical protein